MQVQPLGPPLMPQWAATMDCHYGLPLWAGGKAVLILNEKEVWSVALAAQGLLDS
jgi:hypothetical protein